jgi:hypothetical protein
MATLYRFDTPPHRTVLSFCRLGLGSRRLYSNQYKAKTYLVVTSTTMFPIPEWGTVCFSPFQLHSISAASSTAWKLCRIVWCGQAIGSEKRQTDGGLPQYTTYVQQEFQTDCWISPNTLTGLTHRCVSHIMDLIGMQKMNSRISCLV